MTARPEDAIAKAIGMMELGHGDYARATEALAALLAEQEEREEGWKEAWKMRMEQYHAAEARAVAAEAELDDWHAQADHRRARLDELQAKFDRHHGLLDAAEARLAEAEREAEVGRTAAGRYVVWVERAGKAEARLRQTEQALRDAADTFAEMSAALNALGHPTMAQACVIAESGMRAALDAQPAELSEPRRRASSAGTQTGGSLTSPAAAPPSEPRECGCEYELVEDGAMQRKRWFHEPGCTGVVAPPSEPRE